MSFFTFSENEIKAQIFVLKRHHYVKPEALLATINEGTKYTSNENKYVEK